MTFKAKSTVYFIRWLADFSILTLYLQLKVKALIGLYGLYIIQFANSNLIGLVMFIDLIVLAHFQTGQAK